MGGWSWRDEQATPQAVLDVVVDMIETERREAERAAARAKERR